MGSCHRDAVREELPKKRGRCPSAKVIDGSALEMRPYAALAHPNHQTPNPSQREHILSLSSPPRPTGGRGAARRKRIPRLPHRYLTPQGSVAACVLSSPPRPARGSLQALPAELRPWHTRMLLFKGATAFSIVSCSDQRSPKKRSRNPRRGQI
jgi:hypothetical protein